MAGSMMHSNHGQVSRLQSCLRPLWLVSIVLYTVYPVYTLGTKKFYMSLRRAMFQVFLDREATFKQFRKSLLIF
jgi:hypothetical protein